LGSGFISSHEAKELAEARMARRTKQTMPKLHRRYSGTQPAEANVNSTPMNTYEAASKLFLLGTSFKKSPLELRESFAASRKRTDGFACHLQTELGFSVFILSTCNRYEIYLFSQHSLPFEAEEIRRIFLRSFELKSETYERYFYEKCDQEALQHLLSVAAGLDSQVVGETQIAFQIARTAGSALDSNLISPEFYSLIGSVLNNQKMIRETARYNLKGGSIASTAYHMLESRYGDIWEKNILLVGAGTVVADLLELLSASGAHLRLASTRSRLKAEALSLRYGSPVMTLAEAKVRLSETDILISATASPYPIFHREEFKDLNKPLVIFDLALPRDVSPEVKGLKDIQLFNMDDIGAFAQEIYSLNTDLSAVEKLVKDHSEKLWNEKISELAAEKVPSH
jgi:glutamyl-tRNA reductase